MKSLSTSPALRRRARGGINVVLNYTHAYASFAIKAAICPGRAAQRRQFSAGARERAAGKHSQRSRSRAGGEPPGDRPFHSQRDLRGDVRRACRAA